MDVNRDFADPPQDAGRHRASVQAGRRATRPLYLSVQHRQLVVLIHLQAPFRKRRSGAWVVPEGEDGLDARRFRALPHQVFVCGTAQHEGQRIHQQRLARPRLSGNHVEARPKDQPRLFDDGKVPDGELEQHGPDYTSRYPCPRYARATEPAFRQGAPRRFTWCARPGQDSSTRTRRPVGYPTRLTLARGAPGTSRRRRATSPPVARSGWLTYARSHRTPRRRRSEYPRRTRSRPQPPALLRCLPR